MPICKINEKYQWLKCKIPPTELDSEGFCILHSPNSNKNQNEFNEIVKIKLDNEDYDFSYVSFPGNFILKDVIFSDRASFIKSTFYRKADFDKLTFKGEADFCGVTFLGESSFDFIEFQGKVTFESAVFSGKAFFFGNDFLNDAIFELAIFEKESIIEGCDFSGELGFFGAKILNELFFLSINRPDKPFRASFSSLALVEKGLLKFEGVSLNNVNFIGTDLKRLEFHNVNWCRLKGRNVVYDEILLRKLKGKRLSDGYPGVEKLYRQLKLNYEREGDFIKSGDFHYGEMEMHRRASKWRWFPFYWYNLYKVLSGYGERPSWALGWLAGFLLALPLLVWGFGLDKVAGGTSPGFLETFTYIFEKATFQRPSPLSNLNFLGSFISNLSLLIIPGQAALFLLALRNRLGRRR